MRPDFDIAVIGSGFAGSLMAMIARRLGHSVVLVERERHPRFAIGESSTPLANLLLEELARRYDLPHIASLSKWGTWQKAHPEIACGLKRGFTFYHHQRGQYWLDEPGRRNQLLVAASPHDGIADTHWYRPDFDQFLARQAVALGAEYLDEMKLSGAKFSDAGAELSGERDGQPLTLRARFVIDASGPRGFLHRALVLPETPWAGLPATRALYTHFEGVNRWEAMHAPATPPPYPVDDAAMHHVFAGGWIWVLRFNNGITSAGVAMTGALADEVRLAEGAPAWDRVLARLPSVREQFAASKARLPFRHTPALPFRSGTVAGDRWALLPSAAGFVDPLLSTGFPLTLLGLGRLAKILETEWDTGLFVESPHGPEHPLTPFLSPAPSGGERARRAGEGAVLGFEARNISWGDSLRDYSRQTLAELDVTAQLVNALYANLNDFEVFAALTQLYFTAAMYAETMRRLGRPEGSFLLQDHATFGPASRWCLAQASRRLEEVDRRALLETIARTIEPLNLAGLGDPARRNWYPCNAADLLAAAPKLGVSRPALEQLLTRSGFAAP